VRKVEKHERMIFTAHTPRGKVSRLLQAGKPPRPAHTFLHVDNSSTSTLQNKPLADMSSIGTRSTDPAFNRVWKATKSYPKYRGPWCDYENHKSTGSTQRALISIKFWLHSDGDHLHDLIRNPNPSTP